MKIPKSVKSRAWVGVWKDGTIGWQVPSYITESGSSRPLAMWGHWKEYKTQFYRCEVIIRPLLDKRGKPIMRRPWRGQEGK